MSVIIPDLQTAGCTELAENLLEIKAELVRRADRRWQRLGISAPPAAADKFWWNVLSLLFIGFVLCGAVIAVMVGESSERQCRRFQRSLTRWEEGK